MFWIFQGTLNRTATGFVLLKQDENEKLTTQKERQRSTTKDIFDKKHTKQLTLTLELNIRHLNRTKCSNKQKTNTRGYSIYMLETKKHSYIKTVQFDCVLIELPASLVSELNLKLPVFISFG